MAVRLGIYGHNVAGHRELQPGDGHVDQHGAVLSQNTRMLPAFGMDYKIRRNRNITVGPTSVVSQTWGYHSSKNGLNVFGNIQEKLSDPLHRDPLQILLRARQESSIAGRMRAYIRPAAPQQVTWKNQYWVLQRTRGARPTTIGPYGHPTARPEQSILSRIGGFLGGSNGS